MLKELLLAAVAEAITTSLKMLLNTHLEKQGREKNDMLKAAIKNSFTLLKDLTEKTNTKLDDTAVNIILNSVK